MLLKYKRVINLNQLLKHFGNTWCNLLWCTHAAPLQAQKLFHLPLYPWVTNAFSHVLVSLSLPVAFKMWQGKVISTAVEKEEGTGQLATHPSKYCPLQCSLQKHPLATEQINLRYTCRLSSFLDCSEPTAAVLLFFSLPCSLFSFLWDRLPNPRGPLLAAPTATTRYSHTPAAAEVFYSCWLLGPECGEINPPLPKQSTGQ